MKIQIACAAVVLAAGLALLTDTRASELPSAAEVLKETSVSAGLAVHVGTTDGALEAGLTNQGKVVVQGLALSEDMALKARRHLVENNLHGQASVRVVDMTEPLPYADNLVNLLVVAGVAVEQEEALRVLAPKGVALFLDRPPSAADRKLVKPWPDAFDDWSHPNHGPNGNPVSQDTAVGPPRHVQWVAGPLWSRTHDSYPSVSAMVTAGGRIFYVLDEGPTGVIDDRFPDRWAVYARDAFNGMFLWRVPLEDWFHVVYKTTEVPLIKGPWSRNLKERLVAQSDLVFVKPGAQEPLVALDAATGEQVRDFPGTEACRGFAVQNDVLVTHKCAYDVGTGTVLWEGGGGVIDGNNVLQYDGRQELRCRDLKTGKDRWTKSVTELGKVGSLIAARGRVFLLGRETVGLSQDDGAILWRKPISFSKGGGMNPHPGPHVAGGRLWSAAGVGVDIETGENRTNIPLTVTSGHHYRCYGAKATDRFLLTSKRGIEFHDLKIGTIERCDWVRPTCGVGFIPANGMVYFPPHPCFCYPGAKLYGFFALTPESAGVPSAKARAESERLRTGSPPVQVEPSAATSRAFPWPTYRHDGRRSGSTDCPVPAEVALVWRTNVGGRLTAPVVADGRLYVGVQDAAAVACLDSDTGDRVWTFGCGRRVDTPPTIHQGLAIFGCTDGWVYAVRVEDGIEAWRFRVAPVDRLVGAHGRLESAWPVKGSVLVQDGKAYAIAGRSSYLDGGIVLVALDPATGKLLHETRVSHASVDIPVQSETLSTGFAMEGARPEIPIGDGERVYMRQYEFDGQLTELPIQRVTKMGDRSVGRHLMATSDLLDDSGFNRTYWIHARRWPGFYFAPDAPKTGQMLVFDDSVTYGVKAHAGKQGRHSPIFFPADKGWLLFADDNGSEPVLDEGSRDRDKGKPGLVRGPAARWSTWTPILVRAMVLTGTPARDGANPTLFLCGPPDEVDVADPLAAYEGRKGAILRAVSAADGKTLADLELDVPPVWDGLIAAEGRLFIALADGSVACLSGGK